MNNNLEQVMLEYFKEYRMKKQLSDSLNKQIQDAENKVAELTQQIRDVSCELKSMQKVIWAMVEHDVDPVEAKMRIDELGKEFSYQQGGNLVVSMNGLWTACDTSITYDIIRTSP